MSKYLGYFDAVYYINLDSRIDRRKKFEDIANELNIPATRFSAITASDEEATPMYAGHVDPRRKFKMGCTLSHQAVVRMAKENNFKNCLIFEDDCKFLDKFTTNIQQCVNELKTIEWDLFYLGGEPNNFCTKVTDNLVEIKNGGVYATHAYAINHTFYDKLLKVNPKHVDTIDILYINYDNAHRRVILSKELLVVQDVSYSDLWGTVKDARNWMQTGWDKYIVNER